MTRTQYIIAKFLKRIGLAKKNKRLLAASNELQLINLGEELLGMKLWPHLAEDDDFQGEYWSIADLLKKKQETEDKIYDLQQKVDTLKEKRKERFLGTNQKIDTKKEAVNQQLSLIDRLRVELEKIEQQASQLMIHYDGLVAKVKTLEANGISKEVLDKEVAIINEVKEAFNEKKENYQELKAVMAEEEEKLTSIRKSFTEGKTSYKDEVSINYNVIGKANQAISTYRSNIGVIDGQLNEQFTDLGKRIANTDNHHNGNIRRLAKKEPSLFKKIHKLRESLQYNIELSER